MSLVVKTDCAIIVWIKTDKPRINPVHITDSWPQGWHRDNEDIYIYQQSDLPERIRSLTETHTFVAHNAANFDAPAWNCLIDPIHDPEWFDTIHPARAGGYPADLDSLGQRFCHIGKDKMGAAALELLWQGKMTKDGVYYYPGTENLWKMIIRYNIADVLLLETVYNNVKQFVDPPILITHEEINQRGVMLDREYAIKLVDLWDGMSAKAGSELSEATGGKINVNNMRSGPAVKNWLATQGFVTSTLERKALQHLYDNPDDYFGEDESEQAAKVIEVLKLRQMATRTGSAKIKKALSLCDEDGRIRHLTKYHVAHTGRFSSHGLQAHNFARGISEFDCEKFAQSEMKFDDLQAFHIDANDKRVVKNVAPCSIDDCLATVTRHMFVAPPDKSLLIADYAAVEARCVAWLAIQEDLLRSFANGDDIYCQMASKVFNRPITKKDKDERDLGKRIILGCGYGMASQKFFATCRREGCDIDKFGISADECVEAYRNTYPKIAGIRIGLYRNSGLWQNYQRTIKQVISEPGTKLYCGRCWFTMEGKSLSVKLPSGRKLFYHNTRMELRPSPWGDGEVNMILYDHVHGYETSLYGGKITENISQAICRDLLCDALVKLNESSGDTGAYTVLHVHDEIVMETESQWKYIMLEEMVKTMADTPTWAKGFPVAVEGFTSPRYSKSKFTEEFEYAQKSSC